MIDRFNKDEFEKVLETFGRWKCLGLVMGEYRYDVLIHPDKFFHVIINSSIDRTGVASDTGENSIRVWLADSNDKPIIGKLQKWITRIPGWDKRLKKTVDELMNIGMQVRYCEKCKSLESVFVVKKEGVNKGRLFKKCKCENSFQWIITDD